MENDNVMSTSDFMKIRNTVEISGLASTAIRYDASSRMAGALATAYLGDGQVFYPLKLHLCQ